MSDRSARSKRLHRVALAWALLMLVAGRQPAVAMPAGRAWTPIDTLKVNGHAYMVPDRFEPLRDDRLELIAAGYYGNRLPPGVTHRTYGLVWADSLWRVRWTLSEPAYRIRQAITPPEHQMLVWKTTSPPVDVYYNHLVTADVVNGALTEPDTIARVTTEALVYAGTAWGSRRWVAVRDRDFSVHGFPEVLRILRSDRRGEWREMGPTGMSGWNGMRIAALDSSTVLVLSSDYHTGVRWGYLRDTSFSESVPELTTNSQALLPGFARWPGAGFWVGLNVAPDIPPDYSDRILLRSFRDGAWAAPETLAMSWPQECCQIFRGVELGADGSEFPAVTWHGYSYQGDAAWHVWTALPSETGLGVGERFEGSRDGINSIIVRDENGDAWLAWWRTFDGVFWSHTYTSATCTAPVIEERNGRPLLQWRLSQPAPGSWWAVLRSDADGAFERVARVRATSDSTMSWPDSGAPIGMALRYAVRRESRDVRYRWTSEEARWEPRGASLGVVIRSGNPARDRLEFEVTGANQGLLELRMYDLLGREVLRRVAEAAGPGRDVLAIPLTGGFSSGLYFIRVTAADGRRSPPAKIAILR